MVFTTSSNYLRILDKYIDREVLPPCICKEGRGSAVDCMPQNFEGGILPPHAEASIPDEPWITNLMNTSKLIRQRREKERNQRRKTSSRAKPLLESKLPSSPVCLSEYKDVQVLLQVHEPRRQDEFETVLMR